MAATQTRWGLSAGSSLYQTCWPYYCNGVGAQGGPYTGQGLGNSTTSSVSATFASASASVYLITSNSANFPAFDGQAVTANTGLYWASSSAVAIEGYRYLGTTNRTLIFGGSLSGTTTATRTSEGLTAKLYIFRSTNFVYQTHLPTLLYETGAQLVTNLELYITSTNRTATVYGSVAFTVSPGELFYVYASLGVSTFQQNGFTTIQNPYQIYCSSPEALISESNFADVPLAINRTNNQLRLSWPARRLQILPEYAADLFSSNWKSLTNAIFSDAFGNWCDLGSAGPGAFYRLRIQP